MRVTSTVICLLTLAGLSAAQVPTDGLLRWYKFDDSSYADAGPAHVTLTPWGRGPIPCPDRFGVARKAFEWYPGAYIYALQAPDTDLPTDTASRTVCFWLWLRFEIAGSSDSCMQIVSWGLYNDSNFTVVFRRDSLFVRDGQRQYYVGKLHSGLMPTYTWTHIAVTVRGTELRFYLNGSLFSTRTVSPFKTVLWFEGQDNRFLVGSYWSTRVLKAALDDLLVYGRALTATEVAGIYNPSSAEPRGPVVPSRAPFPRTVTGLYDLRGRLLPCVDARCVWLQTLPTGAIEHDGWR